MPACSYDVTQRLAELDRADAQAEARASELTGDAPFEGTVAVGKGYSWLARRRNAQLEDREDFKKNTGKALKQRMGGILSQHHIPLPPLRGARRGALSGGQSDAHRKKA